MVEELLDQEGLEVDPVDRLDKETPLHKAVKYANTLDAECGEMIVEMLLDAGADPRYFLRLPLPPPPPTFPIDRSPFVFEHSAPS